MCVLQLDISYDSFIRTTDLKHQVGDSPAGMCPVPFGFKQVCYRFVWVKVNLSTEGVIQMLLMRQLEEYAGTLHPCCC